MFKRAYILMLSCNCIYSILPVYYFKFKKKIKNRKFLNYFLAFVLYRFRKKKKKKFFIYINLIIVWKKK